MSLTKIHQKYLQQHKETWIYQGFIKSNYNNVKEHDFNKDYQK